MLFRLVYAVTKENTLLRFSLPTCPLRKTLISQTKSSLRGKRFCLVSEQKGTVEGDFRFWSREKLNENQQMKETEKTIFLFLPHLLPVLLLAPFFARSFTRVPRSLLLNRTETLAKQARLNLVGKASRMALQMWSVVRCRLFCECP